MVESNVVLFVLCIALSTTHECNMVKVVQERDLDFSSVKLKCKYIRGKMCIYIGIGIGQN